jgi:hypothetical protein
MACCVVGGIAGFFDPLLAYGAIIGSPVATGYAIFSFVTFAMLPFIVSLLEGLSRTLFFAYFLFFGMWTGVTALIFL